MVYIDSNPKDCRNWIALIFLEIVKNRAMYVGQKSTKQWGHYTKCMGIYTVY